MRHKENAQAALEFIQDLPEKYIDLEDYTTEVIEGDGTKTTAHCLGGWLPHIGHFKELGVVASSGGYPLLHTGPVTRDLFGSHPVFYYGKWREFMEDFPETATDKEEVIQRLLWVINQ